MQGGRSAQDVEIRLVDAWDVDEIAGLYRTAGWWKDSYEAAGIGPLIHGSFAFAVALDRRTAKLVGMGRAIADGVSDAYIQDLVVLPEYRRGGIGRLIVAALVRACEARGIGWIGLIAEPGSEHFYRALGFRAMPGHVPMIYGGDR